MTNPTGENASDDQSDPSDDVWEKLARLPSMDDAPLDETWVGRRPPSAEPDPPADPAIDPSAPNTASGQYHVPAPEPAPVPSSVPPTTAPPETAGVSVAPALPERRPRRRRRRRGRRRLVLTLVVVLILGALAGFLVAWATWSRVDKVAIAGLAGDTSAGTNYLIVGTDSRAGVDTDLATAGGIFGDGTESFEGARTDTIVILRVAPDGNRFLSLNRDLWIQIADGGEQRINAAFNFGGPQQLIDTIQQSLGLPIHHYMEVDFAGFLGLVDTIGGIDVEVANPAFDPKTGLNISQAGLVHLDGEQALAYVRTRNYIEIIDGQQVRDPSSDFGRVKRQQQFLEAVFNEVGGTRNPVTLLRAARSLTGNVRIDDTWGFWEALRFGRNLKSLDPVSLELPVFDFTGPNGEAVLGLSDAAPAVLDQFR